MAEHNWPAIIEGVAKSFWGDPNPKLSTPKALKWGNQGSRSISLEKGTWFDHEAGTGGGVAKLVQIERGLGEDEAAAMAWLEENGFIASTQPRQERRERAAAPQTALDPEYLPQGEDIAPPPAEGDAVEYEAERFDYANRDGEFQYRVVRYQYRRPDGSLVLNVKTGKPEKTFRQKSRNAAGQITGGLNGREPCLYRWQEIDLAIEAGKTILIVEGEKAVAAAVALGFEATCNSGGAGKTFTDEMVATFKGARVVILPDNDPQSTKKVKDRQDDGTVIEREVLRYHPDGRPAFAGQDHADTIACQLRKVAASVKVLLLPGIPLKGDIVEWVEAGGTADELQRIVDSLPDWKPRPPVSKIGAIGLSRVGLEAKKHQWLVHDMIELGGSAAFAGFSQSGKSFLMIELAFCVALGKPFWGRDVKQGLVIYQTGEGDRGFMKRVEGYMLDRGIEDPAKVPMTIIPHKINLFVDDKYTNLLIEEAKQQAEHMGQPLRLIVIDTFNKATRGANEISGLDMGKVIDRIERIAGECGCTVMVVDHLSAQGKFRGHGSKTGDLTNVIMVEMGDKTDRNGRKIRRMRLDKNKDGENGGTIPFVLRQVVVGFDELGRPITTCVVDPPDGDDDEETKRGRLSQNQAVVLQTLRDVIGREGEAPPVGVTGVPKGRNVVGWRTFMAEMRKKWVFTAPENESEKRTAELHRVLADAGKKLQLAGFIDRDNERGLKEGEKGIIWWTGKEDRVFVKPAAVPAESAPALPPDVAREMQEAGDDCPF